jgi:DNA-binding beta-propeller fold protein YncE
MGDVCRRLALGLCVTLGAQPSPYRILVAAESEDQVALVEFRPCGPTGGTSGCGATVVRTYAVGVNPVEIEGPHGVVASSDSRSFYVTMAHGRPYGSLLQYDLASGALTGQVELGMFPATIDLTVAGDLAYVVNFNFHDPAMQPSSLSVVDLSMFDEVARTTTCRMPHGSRLSRDGTRHYSACMMDDLLVEVDTRTTKISRLLRLTSGSEGTVAVDELSRARHAGHHASTPAPASLCSPTWAQPSVDGATVWVACNRSNEIVIVDVAKWQVLRRVKTPATPYNLAATDDGALMVVTHKGPGSTTVWRTRDASLATEVRGLRRIASGIAVSADSRFAFVTFEGKNDDPGTLDIIDLAAGKTVASVNDGKQAGGVAIIR